MVSHGHARAVRRRGRAGRTRAKAPRNGAEGAPTGPDDAFPRHPPESAGRQGPRIRPRAVPRRPAHARQRQRRRGRAGAASVAQASVHRGLAPGHIPCARAAAGAARPVRRGPRRPRRRAVRRRASGGGRSRGAHRAARRARVARQPVGHRGVHGSRPVVPDLGAGGRRASPHRGAGACPQRPPDAARRRLACGERRMSAEGGRAGHVPVMLAEVLAALAPHDGGSYLDATFGGGGYAAAILQAASCVLYAIDRDPQAIARGAALAARYPGRLHLIHGRFGDLCALLSDSGVSRLDGVVFDFGVSSFQLDDAARGFSFRADGPLDMRMDASGPTGGPTAAELIATMPERELTDMLYEYGEERQSRRIARAILRARAEAPIETTGRLAEIIRSVLPPDRSGIDPATRSFQALRIRVNDELGEIARGLSAAASMLAPGGRLVVVAFHSLEDRIVKRFMTEAAGRTPAPSRHDPGQLRPSPSPAFRLLTPRALRPGAAETAANPRARSARLRAIARLEISPNQRSAA